jgi:hypothetical protein
MDSLNQQRGEKSLCVSAMSNCRSSSQLRHRQRALYSVIVLGKRRQSEQNYSFLRDSLAAAAVVGERQCLIIISHLNEQQEEFCGSDRFNWA